MPIRRTYVDIKTDGKVRLKNSTPITDFGPTSIAASMLDVVAGESDSLYSEIEYLHRSIDPTRNYGKELDNLGYMQGVDRDNATIAIDESNTNMYFYLDRSTNSTPKQLIDALYPITTHSNIRERLVTEGFIDNAITPTKIIIPKNTKVYNANRNVTYITLDATEITSTNKGYVGVIAKLVGKDNNVEANVLIKHDISDIAIIKDLAKFIFCTNTFPIQSGGNSMTDDEYRYKITQAPQLRNVNEQTIRNMALSIPGVRNIFFTRSLYGYGTIGVLVEGTSPLISQGLVDIIASRLDALSGNDAVFVRAPDYKGVEISLRLIPEIGVNSSNIIDVVRNNIISYINNIGIGGTIIWNDIVSIVMDVDGVFDFQNDYYKVGDYNPFQKLNKKQIVLRTINQRSYETEKFYTDKGLIKVCSANG